ncbi:MAG: Arabinose 5-phosphate isomerase KdsD [Alphaproteobacteria bacterium MarineAlpha6_Bin1]|nr:MAG: Arabinose 5-phosphate isomerase KdsD [Alphaproteobacteria bacterium MarineAlpha6_Bin1]
MEKNIIKIAKQVINTENKGLKALTNSINNNFVKAINILKKTKGRIILTGIGKSGIIANKISSTLSSTGSPSQFIHPAEASHGDLGILSKNDSIIALTFSGKTNELNDIFFYSKENKIPLIIITSKSNSNLKQISKICIELSNIKEACPLNLAPTTSTTAMLALGDAIAIVLMKLKKFTKKDFYSFHPGGELGKKLLLVKNVMHQGNKIPLAEEKILMNNVIIEMSKKRFGCVGVTSRNKKLVGVITDGDLRRHMKNNILEKTAGEIMKKNPKTINKEMFVTNALEIMEKNKITQVFIVQNNKPIGILHIHDCIELGLI